MAVERANTKWIWAGAASVAIHAVTGAGLPSVLSASTRPVEESISEIEFQVFDDPPSPAPTPPDPVIESTPPAEPDLAPASSAPRPPQEPRRPDRRDRESIDSEEEPVGETTASERRTERSEGAITVPGGLRIDPRAVALGSVTGGPREVRPQSIDRAPPESSEAMNRRLREEHSAFLASQGNRRNHVSRREPPNLRQRQDGSYIYTGQAFSARIGPDGTVQFSDRNNVRFGDFGGGDNSLGATVRFDITDALERRHGNDPYQAERRWFLDETEELRHSLEADHRRGLATREDRALRGSLDRLWSDARRTPSEKKASLFRIWDDLADDETGEPMRRVVVTFIRSRLPAGSPDAYSEDELERLNRRRQSREAFAPY